MTISSLIGSTTRLNEAPLVTALVTVVEISLQPNGHTNVLALDEEGRTRSYCWRNNWDFPLVTGGTFLIEYEDAIAHVHSYRKAGGIFTYNWSGRYLRKVVPV